MEGLVKMRYKVKSLLGEYCEENGLNKAWVARQIGATSAQFYTWCKNKDGYAVSTPSIIYLLKLQKVLGVSINQLWEYEED